LNEETTLYKSAPIYRTRRSRIGGFSMVELAVSMTVLLILTAIAIPSLMRSFRTYQLNDAAARLSDMLKFTRFEAVRRNNPVCFLMKQDSTTGVWTLGTASPCSATFDTNGKQQVITGFATLLPGTTSGLPGQAAICNNLVKNSGPCLDDTLSGINNSTVKFDARGAIRVGGTVSSSVFVFYVGSATNPEFGYRAVIQLPSGSTQIWTAPNGGTWQQIS
jgi:Tfp pilus assembly protein PilE